MHLLNRLNGLLLVLGIPGLFAIAFSDSAAVPLAGGPDAFVLLLTWSRPAMVYLIVLAATTGSTLGALVLHGIALKGGEKILSRFKAEKIAWAEKSANTTRSIPASRGQRVRARIVRSAMSPCSS